MTERSSRRRLLAACGLGLSALTGCVSVSTDPRDGADDTPTPTQTSYDFTQLDSNFTAESTATPTDSQWGGDQFDSDCTDARVTEFEWSSQAFGEDDFEVTLLNQADLAGEVTVEITFYTGEDKSVQTGTVQQSVAIGAQATKDVTLSANPPTDDSEWATAAVGRQDCRFDFEE